MRYPSLLVAFCCLAGAVTAEDAPGVFQQPLVMAEYAQQQQEVSALLRKVASSAETP